MKTLSVLLLSAGLLVMCEVTFAQTNVADSVGLYRVVPTNGWHNVKASDGSTIWLGAKSDVRILKAHIYSEDNANTSFQAYLNTSDYPVDTKTGLQTEPVVLRVGEHAYASKGGSGMTGLYNTMMFEIPSREEAEALAKALLVDCNLRTPPGYKFLARFVPKQSEFHADEPVWVKFSIKNLDDRTMVFQNGGAQRGARDNQYGFRAMFANSLPVPDTGNAMNFGGLCTLVSLKPGKEFSGEVDLKKWFSFDKQGTYFIHGFYSLSIYSNAAVESMAGWNVMWSDYASADFQVVVK
jgi:hypothetical protein